MRKNNGSSSIILLVFAIILVIGAGIFWVYANKSATNKKSETQNKNIRNANTTDLKQVNNIEEKENEDEDDNKDKIVENISSWNGVYKNDNGMTIEIYRVGNTELSIDIGNYSGNAQISEGELDTDSEFPSINISSDSSSESFEVEADSDTQIKYNDEYFGETVKLEITKSGNEIELVASSTDEDSILNVANGTYVRESFEDSDWNGAYTNGTNIIVLSQTRDDCLYLSIDKYWRRFLNEYDEEKIVYEDEFIDDEEKITIEKTEKGFKITSSSTDEDDILNEISGKEFEKID